VSRLPERRPAHDAIPPLRAGQCEVWWAQPGAADPRLLELLDDEERIRHAAYLRAGDRDRFLVAHALARILAGAALPADPRTIHYAAEPASRGAARSKPRFAGAAADAGLELSISHSAERVVVALSLAVPIGVDVERIGTPLVEQPLVESVLAPAELRELAALPPLQRGSAFYGYWTRKEAVLKASGDGLSVEPAQLRVSRPGAPPALLDWTGPRRPAGAIWLHELDPGPGYAAALASIGAPLEPSQHAAAELLAEWARVGPATAARQLPATPPQASSSGAAVRAAP
jgi:4'-phosphopantetheinyl transferase